MNDCMATDSLGAGTLAGCSSSESDSSLLELLSFILPVGVAGGFTGPYIMKWYYTKNPNISKIGLTWLNLRLIIIFSAFYRRRSFCRFFLLLWITGVLTAAGLSGCSCCCCFCRHHLGRYNQTLKKGLVRWWQCFSFTHNYNMEIILLNLSVP